MHALAGQRVQIGGERRDQRLALTRAHLGDLAAMEHDAADHLHVIVALAEHTARGFAHGGEGFGQQAVERRAVVELFPELHRLRGELRVGHRLHLGLERGDLGDGRLERLDVTVVGRTEQGLGEAAEHKRFPD